jgi:hypothetical protein
MRKSGGPVRHRYPTWQGHEFEILWKKIQKHLVNIVGFLTKNHGHMAYSLK